MMMETMDALLAQAGTAPAWGIGAVIVILALLGRKTARAGRRTSD